MKHYCLFGIITFLLPQFLFAQITIQVSVTNVSCFGGNNGSAQATASGGANPYVYAWSTGDTSAQISSLPMGVYAVTVSDQTGATAIKSITVTQPPLLGATLNGQPQICTVAPDGFTYVIPTGGTPPCLYSWSNDIHTQLNNYVTANTYTVTVTDTRGCTATGSFTVGYLGVGLYLFTDSEAATCPQPDDGSAMASALSGNAPYQYHWNNGATTSTISGLLAGDYEVTVSDVNGCSASTVVAVAREDVDPTSVQVVIPQCSGQTYDFQSSDTYHIYQWATNDPRDSIVSGSGTSHVWVKWGAPGQKELSVGMSDTLTQCTTASVFKVSVNICNVSAGEVPLPEWMAGPNPFDDHIRIEGEDFGFGNADFGMRISDFGLFNLHGRRVAAPSLVGKSMLIDTKNLLPGIYFLKLPDGVRKMIKG